MSKTLHLGAILHGIGSTTDGWRHPDIDATASTNFDFYKTRAQLAEKAFFDFVFIADGLFISEASIPHFLNRFEPITLLASLAQVTENIGLVGTFSSTYTDPFTLARQLMSLDHLSQGRAGWNVVTSPQAGAAKNYNNRTLPPHDERYEIAKEHLEVVQGLWRSFEEEAFVRNKQTGQYVDFEKMHRLDYQGTYFQVAGPLNIGRSPQGEPVIFQAGASDKGKAFAAKHAEAIFTHSGSIQSMREFYDDIAHQTATLKRKALVLPGISPIIGDTLEDAQAQYDAVAQLIPIEHALNYLARYFDDHDFHQYPLDEPFPELGDIGKEAFRSTTDKIKQEAKDQNLTLRQVAIEQALPRPLFMGTKEHVADLIEEWFVQGAVDGFIIGGDYPHAFERFITEVVPILQKKGIYKTAYTHNTLRGNLGLA